MLNKPQDYDIILADTWYQLSVAGETCKFLPPASTPKRAKLYTVSRGANLIYVGIATQRMTARLRYGFKATGAKGYHGYKWRDLVGSFRLSVWTGPTNVDLSTALLEMETIEAEVAFLCRKLSGQWPSFQQEIHFSPSLPRHRADAKRIYRHATRKQIR